ncbi:MAG: retropepsin-like aspartic protease [Roseiarcus sp.]|jgi:hypothetical protein
MQAPVRVFCGFSAWLALAAPAWAGCGLTRVAQMPLIQLGAHFAVMARVDGARRPMIVDTGAPTTLLTARAAEALDLRRDPSPGPLQPVFGLGQTSAELHLNVIPATLAFGDLVFHDRSTVVAAMDSGALPENDSIGLLGDDILSRYDVEFDFPGRTLTLYRAHGCYQTFLPWNGVYAEIPFEHKRSGVVIDIILDHERTRTLVDTGNNMSFVSARATALWGVRDDELIATATRSSSPLNGGTSSPVALYTFPRIRIGDDDTPSKTMNVIDVDHPLASANLGLDYLGSRRIWLSYPNGWMFVADRAATPTLAYPVGDSDPPPGDSIGPLVATETQTPPTGIVDGAP